MTPLSRSVPTAAGRAVLTLRTLGHLRPSQVAYRARNLAVRTLLSRVPLARRPFLPSTAPEATGWPAAFTAIDDRTHGDGSVDALRRGVFTVLGETRDLGAPIRWSAPGATRLWRFHLHYFEWLRVLTAAPDDAQASVVFADLWRSWRAACPFAAGDPWSPYVTSLRAWNLCAAHGRLISGSEVEDDVVAVLGAHARYLRALTERDVGGNHLVKNLKALAGLGTFLGDDRLVGRSIAALERQLARQVLADGGHYERSPSYHCQVLADVVDVRRLLETAGRQVPASFGSVEVAMRRWLSSILMPDGDVPLFNDATLVGPERIGLLGAEPPGEPELEILQPSGYAVVRAGRFHMVGDVGPPCPPDLPAHAHADCLSFELAVDGVRVIVDSGTSTYEPTAIRSFERSTSAHNTVEVDGEDQTEVWGVFRAARLAAPTLDAVERAGAAVAVVASHDGYTRLPGRPVHRRRWSVGDDIIDIVDEVQGTGRHTAIARLHVHPDVEARQSGRDVILGPLTVTAVGGTARLAAAGSDGGGAVATRFGERRPAAVVEVRAEGELPLTLHTRLQVR